MSEKTSDSMHDEFELEKVQAVFKMIPLDKIVIDAPTYSFRDDLELATPNLKTFADDLFRNDILVPIAATEYPIDMYLAGDGHRRVLASRLNVTLGRWAPDKPVPAMVSPAGTSKITMILRAGAANLHRQPFSQDGRVRFVLQCHLNAVPKETIAEYARVSPATISRILKLARHPWMVTYVDRQDIPATLALELLIAAEKAGRVTMFQAQFEAFAEKTRAAIAAEVQRRKAGGLDPLPDAKLKLRSYITPELEQAWKSGIAAGTETSESEVFEPVIGKHQIQIPAYTADLDDASAAQLAKFHATCLKIIGQVEPIMVRRAAFEKMTVPMPVLKTGADRLKELGLGELVADADETTGVDEAVEQVDEMADAVEESADVPPEEVATVEAPSVQMSAEEALVETAPAEAAPSEVATEATPVAAATVAATALGVDTSATAEGVAEDSTPQEAPKQAAVCSKATVVTGLKIKPKSGMQRAEDAEATEARVGDARAAAATV